MTEPTSPSRIPPEAIDTALTAQLLVAWAGEAGEPGEDADGAAPRLGWWRSDWVAEFGGKDLLRRLTPTTWEWGVWQGAREAARRADEAARAEVADGDRLVSLFGLGCTVDERVEERLQTLKRLGRSPAHALPGLAWAIEGAPKDAFAAWVAQHGTVEVQQEFVGRRVKRLASDRLEDVVAGLVAALAPFGSAYPFPHVRGGA